MTRFWITISEGVDFVLSTLAIMRGGEIFVPKIPSMKITELAEAMAPGADIKVVGIRPGEKLHEMMISGDDARSTAELGDRYAIEPAFVEYSRTPFRLNGGPGAVAEDFCYASNTNSDWLTREALMAMVEEKAA
jgi:UDP-N-acetylglucosamine 4,6-dehydratase